MKIKLLFLALIMIYGCQDDKQSNTKKSIPCNQTNDMCNCCRYQKNRYIETYDSNNDPSKIISKPIAIKFFNLFDKIIEFDTPGDINDSMPEILRVSGRQMVYMMIDQFGMHRAYIDPILDSMKVKTIIGNYADSLLIIRDKNKTYKIKTILFSYTDGIIFFKPGKQPILWTYESNSDYCSHEDFVRCYYR